MRSRTNECNIVYVLKCKCSNKACCDVLLCNKINYDLMPDNFKSNLEFMNIDELRNYITTFKNSEIKNKIITSKTF